MLSKWKRAVVHLECATDKEHFYDRIKRFDEQCDLLEKGQITHEQFAEGMKCRIRDLRLHGTALFLSHKDRRYLLTARHVVWDKHSADREEKEEDQRVLSWPEHMRPDMLRLAKMRAERTIFPIIFRVPSFDESPAKQEIPVFLMNLGAGAPDSVPYTFSPPELDLALISLDRRDSRVADELVSRGYSPIASDDIADGPTAEGQEVFAVGFPSSTALIAQIARDPASAHWSSSWSSLPVFSFGRVSMLHQSLPFFWVDMSIYPGNSGGPVVADDRLIGVVSGQAWTPVEDMPDVRTRIPFGQIIKTDVVRTLLEVQAKKDGRWAQIAGGEWPCQDLGKLQE